MSVPRIREKRLKKPPACDACKARRVLCHSRPDGGPCPRCVEKDIVCTTTAVPRGRPRKGPPPAPPSVPSAASNLASAKPDPAVPPTSTSLAVYSGLVPGCSSDVLDLHPEFVAHCFDCLQYIPQYNHPLMYTTQIKSTARAVSFQLDRLPPQSRVLSLCIVALSSLISFHEFVLGPGPRPQSFEDHTFFMSEHVLACGARRATAYRTLRGEALRTAWELGIILQPSNENAVSCYLLDILDQSDFYRGPSRPWAAAYISHVRALAPILRTLTPSESDVTYWTGFFVCDTQLLPCFV
ncbi:hypothetical protein B0H17DRAFT_1095950 [Mycena rosella]|uniref:Zn(2)-C6 fungal-type domain-containing protein n=1 Tax=Mycena rosella TaxID=1033263 RepID=A0AAD7G4U4_MYCRO|nr:hypothetical protein B0H17DRAFT_1095950 [Mycena rosella]